MEAAAATPTRDARLDRHCLEQIVARSSDGVLLLDASDPSLPVAFANPAFEALTGFRSDEVIGLPWTALQRGRGEHGLDELQAAIRRAEPAEADFPDRRKDGSPWICRASVSPLRDERGKLCFFLVLQRAVDGEPGEGETAGAADLGTARRDLGRPRPKTDSSGRADPVTGLLRYEQFAAIVNRDLAIAHRDRRPITLMAFEIVELDVYRRTFGTKAADSCVRMIGAQISGTLRRAGDLCARYSDSMLVAAVVGQEVSEAAPIAERIVANVRGLKLHNPHALSGRYVSVASALAGGVPGPSLDVDALLERAKAQLEGETVDAAESVRIEPKALNDSIVLDAKSYA